MQFQGILQCFLQFSFFLLTYSICICIELIFLGISVVYPPCHNKGEKVQDQGHQHGHVDRGVVVEVRQLLDELEAGGIVLDEEAGPEQGQVRAHTDGFIVGGLQDLHVFAWHGNYIIW